MSTSTFADRLNELIFHYRLNKNSMSVKLGFTANVTITRLANHPDRNPSYEVIGVLLTTFPEISGRWLILGEGKMLAKDEIESNSIRTSYFKQDANSSLPCDPAAVPTDKMRIFGFSDCDIAVDVYGDSMAPKFLAGDIILCKKVGADDPIAFGEAYLMFTNEPLIRYIKSEIDADTLKVGAENSRYEDNVVRRSDIKCLCRIKGLIRRESV